VENAPGHFAPGGYVVKESDHFVEVYHGLQDIPKEHKVFSFPKLSIREQMSWWQRRKTLSRQTENGSVPVLRQGIMMP